tara:strand:- start:1045 stop:2037 length:993 start_codon:yes stop_codon:yes gene_type:complete
MRVNIFLRKPFKLGNFSVEIFYNEILNELKDKIDIKIIKVPFKNKGILPRLFNILFCYINQGDINHIVGDISYCSLLMDKRRLVITILDCISLHRNTGFKKFLLKYLLFQLPILKASRVIVISKATKNDLNAFLNINEVSYDIIPVTVSKSFYEFKPSLNFTSYNNNFLIIGTAHNKNIERIALALEGIECKLRVIGKLNFSQKSQLISSKINFKEIDKPLSENEVIDIYKKSNLLLFCSELEGFGMPIIEANLLGINVLTSNISSMPFVASDSAIYVDPLSVTSIKNGVTKFIDDLDLRGKLRKNGYKNADRFLINSIADKHLKLYKSI